MAGVVQAAQRVEVVLPAHHAQRRMVRVEEEVARYVQQHAQVGVDHAGVRHYDDALCPVRRQQRLDGLDGATPEDSALLEAG